jgi:hypothetical protein
MVSEELKGMIPDFARGQLSSADAAKVRNALTNYPELIQEYENAKRYYQLLDLLPKANASPEFIDRVNKNIDRESLSKTLTRLLFKPLTIKLPLELAAVTACLLAVVVIIKPSSYLQKTTEISSTPPLAEKKYTNANQPAQVQKPIPEQIKSNTTLPTKKQQIHSVAMGNTTDKKPAVIPQERAAMAQVQKPQEKDMSAKKSEQIASKQQYKRAASSLGTGASAKSAHRTSTEGTMVQTTDFSAEEHTFDNVSRSSGASEPVADATVEHAEQSAMSTGFSEIIDIGTIEISYAISGSSERTIDVAEAEAARAPATKEGLAKSEFAKSDNNNYHKEKMAKLRAAAPAAPSFSTRFALDSVLLRYDSHLVTSTLRGKTTYTLTITPSHLVTIRRELENSFRMTHHTIDFDPQQTERIKVTFVVNQ